MKQNYRLDKTGFINRKNLRGKHSEFWHHIAGCRQWFKVLRSTITHEIFKTAKTDEEL